MKWITPSPATGFGIWIISSLCGAVIFAAWQLAVHIFKRRGYFYFFYKLLRLMPVFFCLPSLIMLFYLQLLPDSSQLFYLFATTPPIRITVFILIHIWAAGTIFLLGFYLYEVIRMQLLYRRKIPCKREILQLYENICREVGGKRFPALCQSYNVKVPILTGIFRPRIYLPVSDWPKQQLSIIFTHELNHFRQGDIRMKRFAALLVALQWVNPAVWIFYKTIILWSEYACDWLSYPLCGGKRSYFQVITSIAEKRGETRRLDVSALFTDTGELERRVQHVQWCGKKRKGSFLGATLLTCAIIAIGAVVTYHTATFAIENSYDLYLATENSIELPQAPPPTECRDYGPSKKVDICCGATDNRKDGAFFCMDFKWELDAHTMCHTVPHELFEDTCLLIMMHAYEFEEHLCTGYMDKDGNRSFVDVSDSGIQNLEIPKDGEYKIFIENKGDSPVEISGSFTLINEDHT